ncbi:Regulatory protein SWI6 [Ceratocystis lukuohia]|uniref:Regulatory protein SWI6 n=1 Tax=Ceratocystis lukuohia TaxID=2019550 RepID=A0ABR4MDF1_9PEZI
MSIVVTENPLPSPTTTATLAQPLSLLPSKSEGIAHPSTISTQADSAPAISTASSSSTIAKPPASASSPAPEMTSKVTALAATALAASALVAPSSPAPSVLVATPSPNTSIPVTSAPPSASTTLPSQPSVTQSQSQSQPLQPATGNIRPATAPKQSCSSSSGPVLKLMATPGASTSQPQLPTSASIARPASQPNSFAVSVTQPPSMASAAQLRLAKNNPAQIEAPSIYSAIYSGVDVYEMEVNNIAVMRRRNDSWLNATQILKVAKIDKGKRTKILEKEIQTGEHEKVQGGYGKYQGTWVKFERGLDICRHYGVEEILRPLLTHDMGQDGTIAGRDVNTPTKEQAMAAQRKRMYNPSTATDTRQNGVSGTFFRNISSTASHAVAAINKARFDSPGPRNRSGTSLSRAPSFTRQSSKSQGGDGFPTNSQQSFTSDYGSGHDTPYSSQQMTMSMSIDMPEPPLKRARSTLTPADSCSYGGRDVNQSQNFPVSSIEAGESFSYSNGSFSSQFDSQDGFGPLPPLPYEASQEADDRKAQLLGLFLDHNISEQQIEESIKGMTPVELDMSIDNHCHTVLHWAAALSRMTLLRALIRAGASPFRVNAVGQTALMRACTVTNSMELNTFPELLDVLGCTLEIRDNKGRTVLHQIAVTSAVKGRNAASRYYLESLLEWVVRQGSVPNSQVTQSNGIIPNGSQQPPKMGLARFMSEIVNAQDNSGDSALNIAAKNGNRSVISQLLEVGADPNIPNRSGLRPIDFGIGGDASDVAANGNGGSGVMVAGNTKSTALLGSQKSTQSNDEIMSSISLILNEATSDFHKEIKSKQASVDSLHKEIRTASSNLCDARRKLDAIQEKVRKQTHARQQIANLMHASEDEQFRSARDSALAAGRSDPISSWEAQISSTITQASDSDANSAAAAASLPSSTVLKTRIKALTERKEVMRKMVLALKGRSKETEVKYRKVVSLCTGVPVDDVDSVVEGLLRAVESEKAELELGRVRRFLGGVEEGAVR